MGAYKGNLFAAAEDHGVENVLPYMAQRSR